MNKFLTSAAITFGYNALRDAAIASIKKSFSVKLKDIQFLSYDKEKTTFRLIFDFKSSIKNSPEMIIKGKIYIADVEIAEFEQVVKIQKKQTIPFSVSVLNNSIKKVLSEVKKNQDLKVKGNVKFRLLGIKFNFGFEKKENIFKLLQ